eukprot:scaffold4302_cov98-Isochrysis_galbana.AAC.5
MLTRADFESDDATARLFMRALHPVVEVTNLGQSPNGGRGKPGPVLIITQIDGMTSYFRSQFKGVAFASSSVLPLRQRPAPAKMEPPPASADRRGARIWARLCPNVSFVCPGARAAPIQKTCGSVPPLPV